MFHISVIICTFNREQSLARTLQSISRVEIPPGTSWELLLVDNNSSDGTRTLAESYEARLPLRYIFESNPGLSNARNAGVAAAQGQYILWTDDDVEVDRKWLASYVEAFRRWPNAALFGGRSVPVFEEPVVEWFRESRDVIKDLLAERDFAHEHLRVSLANGVVPFGLNYAARRDVQRKFLYDPELGVGPSRRIGGEEVDFYTKVLNAGYEGVWLRSPVVYHHIPQARQNLEYITSYYDGAGRTWCVMQHRDRKLRVRLLSVFAAKFIATSLLYAFRHFFGTKQKVRAVTRRAYHRGVIKMYADMKLFSG
jgi:glycosyltransferase involved in cell wall biosynthesis